ARLDGHVRLIFPIFGGGRREASTDLGGPPVRHRERPVQEARRPAIDPDGGNRHGSREDRRRSDHVHIDETDDRELKRALAGVEPRECSEGSFQDIDPLIARGVGRLLKGPTGGPGGVEGDGEHHEEYHGGQGTPRNPLHRRPSCGHDRTGLIHGLAGCRRAVSAYTAALVSIAFGGAITVGGSGAAAAIVSAFALAFVVAAAIALLSDELVFRPLFRRAATSLHLLVASIGVGLIIRYALSLLVAPYDFLVVTPRIGK